MKNLFLWYLPQATLVCFGIWVSQDLDPPVTVFAGVIAGVMFAAAYTGAANLVLSLRSKWIARRNRNRSQPPGDLRREGAPPRLRR